MTIKGYPSQAKLIGRIEGLTPDQYESKNEFCTVQPLGVDKHGLDAVTHGAFVLSASKTVEAGSGLRLILCTAHGARKGDFVRFLDGANVGLEASILSCPDVDSFVLANMLLAAPGAGDTFAVMRYVTTQLGQDGSISVSIANDSKTEGAGFVAGNTGTMALGVSQAALISDIADGKYTRFKTNLKGEQYTKDSDVLAAINSLLGLSQKLSCVDFLDTPFHGVLGSNIPKSSSLPLQVVAALAANVKKLKIVEDIGEFMGIYGGGAGVEVLLAVLPLGGGELEIQIPAGTRISLRNMKDADIASDTYMAINFLG